MKLHKNSLKLSLVYVSIIMFISLFFSISLYRLSINGLDRGLRRSPGVPQGIRSQLPQEIQAGLVSDREQAFEEARQNILSQLVSINLMILVSGSLFSYYLALRTLRPIENANQNLENFTADASHELRTPLASMRSEIEVALSDRKLSLPEAKSLLSSNLEEVEKLTNLTQGLLRLARLKHNEIPMEDTSISELIDSSTKAIEKSAKAKKIKLEIKATSGYVSCEKSSIIEAIMALLDNAVKHSPVGSPVGVVATKSGSSLEIGITDNGPGIRPSEIPHIFDRFYRSDLSRSKAADDGYGLGLAIAKDTVDAHGASLSVQSEVGKGSTFKITFPKNMMKF